MDSPRAADPPGEPEAFRPSATPHGPPPTIEDQDGSPDAIRLDFSITLLGGTWTRSAASTFRSKDFRRILRETRAPDENRLAIEHAYKQDIANVGLPGQAVPSGTEPHPS
jgi:hypothetical protein